MTNTFEEVGIGNRESESIYYRTMIYFLNCTEPK